MSDHTLPAPVQTMIDAINAADTEAFVDAFTADGFVSDWGTVKAGPLGCATGRAVTRSAPVRR